MNTPELYTIVLFVKLRGGNEWLQSAKLECTQHKVDELITGFKNFKKLDHLHFTLPDGTTVYVHPDDISYVNVRVILSLKQRLKNLFTFEK